MKKTLFLSLFIFVSTTLAHAQLNFWSKKEMLDEMEDHHVTEPVSYPNSPFNPIIQQGSEGNQHHAYILTIGDEALTSRIHLIRAAKKSILIQTFIWRNDESGRYVAYELLQAAKRGVKVKLLIDAVGAIQDSKLAAFLATAHPNLEIKYYNPNAKQIAPSKIKFLRTALTKFRQVNQRMHHKTFIVDDHFCITGGRNYENDYFDRGATRNFKDRDILIIGPVVREFTDVFSEYWAFKLSIPDEDLVDIAKQIKKDKFDKFYTREQFNVGEAFDDADVLSSDWDYIKRTFVDRLVTVDNATLVSDKPGKNDSFGLRGGGLTAVALSDFLKQAQESIIFETPYLVLDRSSVKYLKQLRKSKPDLQMKVSTNSLGSTDHIHTYAFAYKQKKLFVKDLKLQVFELKPVPQDISIMMPRYQSENREKKNDVEQLAKDGNVLKRSANLIPAVSKKVTERLTNSIKIGENDMESDDRHLTIHGKSFVLDGEKLWIGTFNVDPRSANLNTELGLIINDKTLAQQVESDILMTIAPQNSWTIGPRKKIPGVSHFSGLIGSIMEKTPVVDIWPFRYTSSYEIKEGKEPVPFYHPDFYDHYISVGSFPGVGLSVQEIQIRLIKSFGGFATPII